jgi:hypothetical protein
LPAIACRISSLDGSGFAATSADALDDLPGVQKPHCSASVRDERVDERVVAQPLDRRHLAALDRVHERDAREVRHAVDEHRAARRSALAAGDLRARHAEVVRGASRRACDRPAGSTSCAPPLTVSRIGRDREDVRAGCTSLKTARAA